MIVLVIYLAVLIARVMTKPLALIEEETRKIQALDLAGDTPTSAFGEISDVLSVFDRMKRALCLQALRSGQACWDLDRGRGRASLGWAGRGSHNIFPDIEGFSSFAEKVDQVSWPQSSVITCNALQTRFIASGGTVDSIGDAIMAF